jgi:hypothetical protein
MKNPYNLNDFQWKMFNLDAALTGHAHRLDDVLNMVRNQPSTAAKWIDRGGEWYLSDGGYSRICFSEVNDFRLFVTSNSTDKVKSAFSRCSELVSDVENALRRAYRELVRESLQ